MKDKEKTKEQLLKELKELPHRIAELETLQVKRKQTENALYDSEDKYRTIFETTGTATVIIEEDTTISLANKEFSKLSGYTQEEVEGKKSWTDFIAHKEDLDRMKDYHNARRIDPDAAPRNYEFKFIDKKGAVKYILTTVALIPGTKKSVGSFLDITDRKQAEEALCLNESRLKVLLELQQMPEASMQKITDFALEEGIGLTSSKIGYLAFISEDETVVTMYSWSKDAIKQCAISEKPLVYDVETMGLWGEAVRQRKPIITNSYSTPNPFKKGCPKGHIKIVRHMNIPVFDGKRIVAVAGVGNKDGEYDESDVRQLTLLMQGMWSLMQKKRTEDALRRSEQDLRDLSENSLTGISLIQDNRIIYQNKEQKRLLRPLPGSINLMDFEGIHPEDVEKVKKLYQKIISEGVRTLDTDFRYYPTGKIESEKDMKWVYCRVSLIQYQGKDAVLVNMMDMTKAKELEHLLIIQDKMSSLGRVAAGIAHEIRNPLSGINIYLSTLQKIFDRADSLDKVKMILEQLQSASGKIESVIRRVMDFSKPGEPKFVPANINQPIEEAIQLSSVTLRKSEISLEKDLSEDLPQCNADPHLIEEVILNLITNAAEAMKGMEGGERIEITSSMGNKHILVKVSDSGPGVPSNLKEKIFDPFYTTKDGSTGIGLSLSHRVITDHGGSLRVGPSKWGGAEFIIKIPIKESST